MPVMRIEWQELMRRAHARGANGELLPLVHGQESLAELRSLCVQLAGKCPCGHTHHECPFRLLSGLSYCSLSHLVETMSAEDLRELFVMELACRSLAHNPHGLSWQFTQGPAGIPRHFPVAP